MTRINPINWTRSSLAIVALLSAIQITTVVRATEAIPGKVLVILASEEKGQMAPDLVDIRALRQPPFSNFKSMRVLKKSTVELYKDKPVTITLPNGRRLMLILKQQMPDGRRKVQLSINRPNQKDYLPLLEVIAKNGEPFFVAGQKHKGGTLVIGVEIGKQTLSSVDAKKK